MASDALVIIGSGNGLWPVWHQAISSTNVGFLIIGPLWTTLGTFYHNSNKLMLTGLHGRVVIATDPNAETSMWGFWSWQSQRNLISRGNVSAYLISCCTGPKCHIIRIKRYISTKLHIFLSNDWYLQKPTVHDDVIKWKHFPRYWPFVRGIHRGPVNSPHKGQWRGTLMFSLICTRMKCWVNNRKAGDLRRNRAHYDVIVMKCRFGSLYNRACVAGLLLLKNCSCGPVSWPDPWLTSFLCSGFKHICSNDYLLEKTYSYHWQV